LDGKYFYGNIDKIGKKEIAYREIVQKKKDDKVSYQDKIETKLNDLQKEFFRLFRKSFPDLTARIEIEIEKGIIHADNFCSSVTSESKVFGKLSFDIDDTEITVFSDFDHRHFGNFYFDEVKNKQTRNQFTCASVIDYIKDFINGNIIIEYQEQDGKLLRASQYHKDEPTMAFSTTINFQEPKRTDFITKLKNIFLGGKTNGSTILTKRVNWYGEIN